MFDEVLSFQLAGASVMLKLRGIVYPGQNHFTCRMVGRDGNMRFYDGIITGPDCAHLATSCHHYLAGTIV
ncbi:hypothetical protein B0H14DRAFT_2353715 [Mycena olivaceomarginata]|nr:hypothetical protein B0H14DRAFT_2353715 [Mycena olivaceomarginata]